MYSNFGRPHQHIRGFNTSGSGRTGWRVQRTGRCCTSQGFVSSRLSLYNRELGLHQIIRVLVHRMACSTLLIGIPLDRDSSVYITVGLDKRVLARNQGLNAPDGVLYALVGDAAGDQEARHAQVPQDVVQGRRAKHRGAGLGQHQLVLPRADAAQNLRPRACLNSIIKHA